MISSPVLHAKYERGAKIIAIDPRRTELVDHADLWLRLKPGTNVALLNSLAHVIIKEGLANEAFVEARTENFEAFAGNLEDYSPEQTAGITGVEPGSSAKQPACTPRQSAACCCGAWESPST